MRKARGCILNFRKEFAPMVEAGLKCHTFRLPRADGRDPLPGDTLHLYTGLRTKSTRLLRREVCEYSIELTIQQSVGGVHHIIRAGELLGQDEVEALARTDGFANSAEFIAFFDRTYGLPCTGNLIGWSNSPEFVRTH